MAATAPLGAAVLPLGLYQLLVRAYYVRQHLRTPILVTVGFLLLQSTLFVLLAPRLGIAGLTWAAALAGWAQLAALALLLRRDEGLPLASLLAFAARVLLAAAAAAGVAWSVAGVVDAPGWWGALARLAAGGLAGVGTYALASLALRLPEATAVWARLRRRG